MPTIGGDGLNIDNLLESELRQKVGTLSGPSPRVAQSAYHAAFLSGGHMTPLAKLAAMATSKGAAGLAVAALAVGGGSVAAAAATGSNNPSVWGKTVTAAVATCKDQLQSGAHGIGQCVSKVAREKGAEERAAHSQGNGGQGHPSGPSSPHPDASAHPDATDHPDGAPNPHPNSTNHPGGRPSGVPSR